jgi:hypothetical protein
VNVAEDDVVATVEEEGEVVTCLLRLGNTGGLSLFGLATTGLPGQIAGSGNEKSLVATGNGSSGPTISGRVKFDPKTPSTNGPEP